MGYSRLHTERGCVKKLKKMTTFCIAYSILVNNHGSQRFGRVWKLNFEAVIKSAASAASRKSKSSEGRSRGVQDGGSAGGRRPRGTPLELPSLDLGFLEAALAADLITA